mmetsp:Transcript_22744/g.49236  ORF Transcript_22744/g.49236 Transcript_22744/m.49236 type:complete len:391 (-) Transcript_22744:1206-2378(-)|eukprot:CAMPEP_0172315520 /NCGR_PEP_ID=MMETSP1058-20130122/25422_1 /TAXON_ID=83371 /ORGANISM="Detonula confervacea, Strain CCMP 353" /LENGTH=390 /DNA_ID=CAMNT_0013029605 /DNA_START=56 /DNA_END=1228 /DNA_ORIENTATION=+
MKAFFTPMHIGLSCILIKGTVAYNSSSSVEGGDDINNNTLGNDSPDAINVNDGTASYDDDDIDNIHRSSNESDSSSQTSSTTGNDNSSSESINSSNNILQNEGNRHSAYYYNSNQNSNQRNNAKYDDKQTYLDLFGERAKELFTQHIIPSTDEECRWDWSMGRCEPYCSCGLNVLWGDYHLGRSCRFRPSPPPSQVASGDAVNDSSKEETEETSWQEAWQQVWQSQITEGSIDGVSSFVPPIFPKSNPKTVADTTTWDRTSTTCALPPESRYIQIMQKTFTHSAVVLDKFQKLKSTTSNIVDASIVTGRHHWTNTRHKACETVKNKVEERAQVRNQPILLTKQGATWIRRVCGHGSIHGGDDSTIGGTGVSVVGVDDVNKMEDTVEDDVE